MPPSEKHPPQRQRAQGGSRLRSTARQSGKQAKLAQALRRPSTLVESEEPRRVELLLDYEP